MFKRFWWVFLVMIPVGSIIGLLLAAVVTYVMPKKYESEATIEVKPLAGQSASPTITPQFFGTEFEKIKSSNSLGKVVDNLELINRWGVDKETTIRILKGIVTTQNIRGTDLISIRVRHTNKEDTRDITAEVAKVYRDYRLEHQKRGGEQGLIELRKAVQDQEDKVEERRKILVTIARTGSFLAGPNMTEEDVRKAMDEHRAQDVIDAKRNLETDQALLQSLKLKLINADITAKIQDETIVIHEEPQIAQAPASPNVTLNLVLGTALGLLLSPLLSLPLILLLSRLMPVKVAARLG
jgi:uncharacterized protein involved in exopolysaccharide biosynthesis